MFRTETVLEDTSAVCLTVEPCVSRQLSQSQEFVHAEDLEQECVPSTVSMTATVPAMRNAAAMDVDMNVHLHIQ